MRSGPKLFLQSRQRKRQNNNLHYELSQKRERKLNARRQLTQPGKFHSFTGATAEGLVPSGLQLCWRLRLDEKQRLMNESAQMQGRWKGWEEGRLCETEPEPVRWQHVLTCATVRMKSPRLNFITNFWAHFHQVLSFSKSGQNPLSGAHRGFTSQGTVVSHEIQTLFFRSEQFETIPGKISYTLSAPAD